MDCISLSLFEDRIAWCLGRMFGFNGRDGWMCERFVWNTLSWAHAMIALPALFRILIQYSNGYLIVQLFAVSKFCMNQVFGESCFKQPNPPRLLRDAHHHRRVTTHNRTNCDRINFKYVLCIHDIVFTHKFLHSSQSTWRRNSRTRSS